MGLSSRPIFHFSHEAKEMLTFKMEKFSVLNDHYRWQISGADKQKRSSSSAEFWR
jgi:hypothetical protein